MQKIDFLHDILPLKNKMFRLALRITLNSAEAEDIVQETMLKVWNKREEWEKIESMEAYCLTLTRNLAIDKSEKADAHHSELTEELAQQPELSVATPQQELERKEQHSIVKHLINHLPERWRTILLLREVEEKSYREIANILELTEEQVKINLFRARQRIKAEYQKIEHYGL